MSRADVLYYAGAFIYDLEVIKTLEFAFLSFKFKIWDYFSFPADFKTRDIVFRASVYDPAFFMPS